MMGYKTNKQIKMNVQISFTVCLIKFEINKDNDSNPIINTVINYIQLLILK